MQRRISLSWQHKCYNNEAQSILLAGVMFAGRKPDTDKSASLFREFSL